MSEGGFEHREPPIGGLDDEQRPDLIGEADPAGRTGGELLGVKEAFGDPPVQRRGRQLQFCGSVGDGHWLFGVPVGGAGVVAVDVPVVPQALHSAGGEGQPGGGGTFVDG